MAEKHKYTVNRSMQGDKPYERGDTRQMTEVEAAPLLASGALSLPGEEPAEREPAVRHTFGTARNEDRGYVSAATGKRVVDDPATRTAVTAPTPKPARGGR